MKVGIIGLGLIGGSMAIDLKRKGFADEVLGVESDPVNAAAAQKIGLIDRVVTLDECQKESDVIVLAVPVGAAAKLLPGILDGHACIICDPEDSDAEAVALIEDLYTVLNMRTIEMSSVSHDVHTAYVSHISHITSFALALTVLDKEKDEKHIFDLASGGFSSTVRLAKSSPDMWTPILAQNKDNILQVMDTYIEKMNAFRQAIADGDEGAVRDLIEDANRIRRIIR